MRHDQSAPMHAYCRTKPAITLLCGMLWSSLYAADADKPVVLPTVKVTAEQQDANSTADTYKAPFTTVGRTPSELRDVPQATTSITQRVLAERDATTLKEALNNAPGITFNASEGGNSGDGIVMRGFGASGDLYLDNVRDSAQYNRDTFNLDRVEVLRGPASMLYGRGSTGGIVNQVSKTPFQSNLYQGSITTGTAGFARVEADINRKLADDAGLRLIAMKQEAGSVRTGARQDRWGFAPSVKLGIDSGTEVTFSALHYQENNVPDYGVPYYQGQPVPVTNQFYGLTALDREQNRNDVLNADFTHEFAANLHLHNVTRWGRYRTDVRATAPGLPGSAAVGYVLNDASTVSRSRKLRLRDQTIASTNTDLTGQFGLAGMQHDVLVGTEISRETVLITSRNYGLDAQGKAIACNLPSTTLGNSQPGAAVSCPSLVNSSYGDVSGNTLAVYGQDLVTLTPGIKLLLGLRGDHFRTEVSTRPQQGATAGTTIDRRERSEKIWSHRIGVIWQPDAIQSYYVATGTSFNPSAESYAIDPAGANTPPEKNRNVEIGAKWELLDKQLSLRTALFDTVKTNERQTDITSTTPGDDYLLSGRRSTRGLELEAAGQLTDDWAIFAGTALMNPRIDESNRPENIGKVPPNAPRYTANLWTTLQLDANWKLGLGANAMGKRYADRYSNGSLLSNSTFLPAFVRWDASVEYQLGKVLTQLNLYNLTGKRYYEGVYAGFATPGVARSARLTLSYKYW